MPTPSRRAAPAFVLACFLLGLTLAAGSGPAGTWAMQIDRAPVDLPAHWIQGFARPVAGELLVYPWAYPGQARALLTRTTDGRMRIEWEAEVPPAGPADESVSFLWHAGFASGYGAHRFTLSLNSADLATFSSGRDTSEREWTVAGTGGSSVSFRTTRVGTFNELFGFMVLTVPRRMLGTGAPRLAVVGEAAGSADYYMTFQEPVRSWTRASGQQARFRDGRAVLRVELSRSENPGAMIVRSGSTTLWSGRIEPGYTNLLLPAPGPAPGDIPLAVEVDGRIALDEQVRLPGVRSWELHLLPHSHVDIGYSDPQPEVERKQWQNLRDAVALAAKTASYPEDARFRWNIEGLWSVESYLRQAGTDDRAAFIEAVKRGSIGLQANYTNVLTGLMPPAELDHWSAAAKVMEREYGLPVIRSAMHSDIPGLSWAVVPALAQAGVRYFSSGPNYMPGLPDGGDRIGPTLKALGDRPFWWVSPSGREKILFWMAGRGYSWFHGLNMGQAGQASRQPILDYVNDLAGAGYGYDIVQVRYTIGGDNGPVDEALPDFVTAWNETFDAPRLVISTAEASFAEFERRSGATLESRRGDMTPYWEDGAISTAAEEALTRAAVRRLVQAEALWALRDPAGFPAADADEAWRQALLWHEHTWGAAASVSAPDSPDVIAQWEYKRAFATEADRRATALFSAALPSPGQALDIVNTLSFERDGVVVVPQGLTRDGDRVRDQTGRTLPSQRLADGSLAVEVRGVPPFGSTRLTFVSGAGVPPREPVRIAGTILDNGRIRIEVNQSTGAIRSLRWHGASGWEVVTPGPGLNDYLYVPGRDPGGARGVGEVRIAVEDSGPLVATLRVDSDAPGGRSLVRRVRVLSGGDRVDLEDVLDKLAVRDKESAHLAFPFDVPGGVFRVDEGSALVTIERDQLPGSCRDFVGVHSAVDVSNDARGVSLASLDAPLVELAAITNERPAAGGRRAWRERTASGSAVYAYLLNNYWHTNYKADQEGPLRFRFSVRPHGRFDASELRRFGADLEQPLLSVAVSPSEPPIRAPFRVDGNGVVVSWLRPAGGGNALLVRVFNASERTTSAVLRGVGGGESIRVSGADATGRATGAAEDHMTLAPFETMLLRVDVLRQGRQGQAADRLGRSTEKVDPLCVMPAKAGIQDQGTLRRLW